MSHSIWKSIDPLKTYRSCKWLLKKRITQRVYAQIIDSALRYVSSRDGQRLLVTDLWVESLGYTPFDWLRHGFDIYGIDLSRTVCTGAKRIVSLREVTQADILKLPFKSETFDMIVDISTMDHVHPFDAMDVVAEYARVLKLDGILLLCIDSKLSLPWEIYRRTLTYQAWSWVPKQINQITVATHFEILKTFFANGFFELLGENFSRLNCSRWSRLFCGVTQYYVVVARKKQLRDDSQL